MSDPSVCPKRDWQVHCPCWTKNVGPCCACGAGVAAGPQATPQVLWEGETSRVGAVRNPATDRSRLICFNLAVPPGSRVRVVAAPTSQEDDHG